MACTQQCQFQFEGTEIETNQMWSVFMFSIAWF